MIVDGINVIRELLHSNVKIERLLIEDSNNKELINLINLATKKGINPEIIPSKELNKLGGGKSQGAVAYISKYQYCDVEDILKFADARNEKPFIVILDGILDPHNLGAIIRTAECAGVHGIIIPENRSCEVNETVYRTSTGAVANMRIARVTNLTRTIQDLKKLNIWVYALEAGNKRIYEADFTYPTALVIGGEGKGVTNLVLKNVDEVLSIDMFGRVNSLNASNASAIAIYEVVRQRR